MVVCRAVIGSLAHRVEDWQFWSTAQMYTALMERSGRGLAKRCAIGTVLGFAQAVIWETMLWVQRETGSDFAAKVENNLVDRYMSNNYYYMIPHVDARIKDAEERISSDVYGIFYQGVGSMLIGVVRPVSKLIWFTFRIGQM